MKRVLMVVAVVALSLCAGVNVAAAQAADTSAAASGGTWGAAREVAGALNTGGNAGVISVSCASAGSCSAGGAYALTSGKSEAFVVNEKNGTWGTAQEVAGKLNTLGAAQVNSVSCRSAGNCSAGGFFTNNSRNAGGFGSSNVAFVVNEKNGTWGTAEVVPGSEALNVGGAAQITSVSCRSAGNCSAGGFYNDRALASQPFVVNEVKGIWRTAQKVGVALASASGDAQVLSVSCASVGNCGAGGFFTNKSGKTEAFVVSEVNGRWRTGQEVAAALNAGGAALVNSVSCSSAGNCLAAGWYTQKSTDMQAFVVSEVNGRWRTAQEIAAALNAGGEAQASSVSCASAGNCSVSGDYAARSGDLEAFVLNEKNGTLRTAQEVAGNLNTGGNAATNSVSCASAGNCSAGGSYTQSSGKTQAFVVSENNGTWGTAEVVPGSEALNTGGAAEVDSVSCAPAGHCAAGGDYGYRTGKILHEQAFVVNET